MKKLQSYLSQFEKKLEAWLKPLPHLPVFITSWVAKNIWWIIAIVVALSVFGILSNVYSVFSYINFVGNAPSYAGIYDDVLYPNYWLFTTIISLAFTVAVTYIYYKAIPDLKAMKFAGWSALFLVFAINLVRVVVLGFAGINLFFFVSTLIFGAIAAAIGGYVLFELKPYFKK